MDKWFNINKVVQVWSGHSDDHQKMGKLFPPAGIRAIDEYKGSFQFDEFRLDGDGRSELVERNAAYDQWWVRDGDVSLMPFVPPDEVPMPEPEEVWPTPEITRPSDETIGRVVRYLLGL